MATDGRSSNERVVIIGAGLRFASGITHYTYLLSCALKDEYSVGALLMRRLVPRAFTLAGIALALLWPAQ